MFGLDKLDKRKPVRVCEGPIDSFFVSNCVAIASADLTSFDGDVFIWDNEPRSKEICSLIEKAIQDGKSVVIWPSIIKQKDLNEMVLAGVDVETVIVNNTFSGSAALLKFKQWCRL